MSEECNNCFPVRKLGSKPGSLGSYGEDNNIPVITLELPEKAHQLSRESLWRKYGPALIASITYQPRMVAHK